MKFFVVGRLAFGEFLGLGANFRGDCGLGLHQIVEPLTDLAPGGKRRKLNVRRSNTVVVLLPVGDFRFFDLFQIGGLEGVEPAIALFTGEGLRVRL